MAKVELSNDEGKLSELGLKNQSMVVLEEIQSPEDILNETDSSEEEKGETARE